jgi:iron(III) transport system permease protein
VYRAVAPHPAGRIARRHIFASAPRWSVAVVLGTGLLVLAPLASLLATALGAGGDVAGQLVADILPGALAETALLLGGIAVLAGAVGTGAAWLVTAHDFPFRRALAWLLPLPLAVPTYITAYVYVDLLDAAGPLQAALRGLMGWRSRADYWFPEVRSLAGCILVMSFVLYPYVYITARAMFLTQSAAMMEVARTLGANRFELFRTVAVPLARPALAVGLSLALLEALNDIGAAEYLGVRTLTVSVFTTWLNRGSLPAAAQIACAMLAIVIGLILIERRGRQNRSYATSARRARVAQPIRLSPISGALAFLGCALPVVLGFLIPAAFLVSEVAARELLAQLDLAFLRHVATSLGLAASATAAALLLAVVVVTASRFAQHQIMDALKVVVGLGYAVPGTVLALGLLGPLVAFDALINLVWRTLGGARLGLVLMGSAGAIVVAYVVRFLPIATGSLSAGLDRLSAGVDDAARTLGAKPRELVLRIQLPMLRPALASAALLVFVDCLKELPATLLLRPLNTETLATLVYGHASRGSFEDGSLAALVIILVGIWPVMRLTRSAEAARKPPLAATPGIRASYLGKCFT